MGNEDELSAVAREYDALDKRMFEMRAQGASERSEERLLEVLDCLWRNMTREERARVDERNRQATIDGE